LTIFFSDVVAEVTQPSLGVGYEIGRAVAMNKRILCLYRPQEGKSKSSFFATNIGFKINFITLAFNESKGLTKDGRD